jgi:hypothetical protein
VFVTDRGSQFSFWAMESRQICWAHLIRKFASFAGRRGRAGEIGDQLLVWSRVLLHNWHRVRDRTMSPRAFRRVAANVRAVIEPLLEEGLGLSVRGVGGACQNILDHRDALRTFADTDGVEPTNNQPEREFRGFVLWRKATHDSRSDRGDLPQAAPPRPAVSQASRSRRATRGRDSVAAARRPVDAYSSRHCGSAGEHSRLPKPRSAARAALAFVWT